jgi:hypothetical protein
MKICSCFRSGQKYGVINQINCVIKGTFSPDVGLHRSGIAEMTAGEHTMFNLNKKN